MQTTNYLPNDEQHNTVTPSPNKKQRKRKSTIGRYPRVNRRHKRTDLYDTLTSPLSIPTPKSTTCRSSHDQLGDCISVDEYIQSINENADLFGKAHVKVRNLAIVYSYKNKYGSPEPKYWK